jgi:hypothetical protein
MTYQKDDVEGANYDSDLENTTKRTSSLPKKFKNKTNNAKIKISGYFVDDGYPEKCPNFHNSKSINPVSFPHRSGVNFVHSNKNKN